jgi:hypothetical protein
MTTIEGGTVLLPGEARTIDIGTFLVTVYATPRRPTASSR